MEGIKEVKEAEMPPEQKVAGSNPARRTTPIVFFHSFTSIRGVCFRSQSNPFPDNFIDFWNTSGTLPVTNRRAACRGPS